MSLRYSFIAHTMDAPTVLIIDDDLVFSELLTEILHEEGIRVLVEHDGVRGIERARTEQPNLIVMDYMMPQMNGLQALAHMRGQAWGFRLPIILLTNMNEPDLQKQRADSTAFTEVLLKTDWTLENLSAHIREVLASTAQG